MNLIRLIYCSRPFGFDEAMLNGILSDSRRCNERDAITGALICRADVYLQLLEGPEAAVDATFARIVKDNRHLEVNLLSRVPVTDRLFPAWAMRDDPARSWMWTQKEVAAGAI
jgi:Sensors of blue-light using FAD